MNKINGNAYIGSSINVIARLAQHKRDLRRSDCCNIRLQRAWLKYGQDAFDFECIEVVIFFQDLVAREQYWIDHYWSIGKAYNLCPAAYSCVGVKHSKETILKNSGRTPWNKGLRGYKIRRAGDERNRKIGDAQLGSKNHNFGKPTPELVKEKIRASLQGSNCHLAKLNEQQVMEIKSRLRAGEVGSELARAYGVNKVQISAIKTGKTWKHVNDSTLTTSRFEGD